MTRPRPTRAPHLAAFTLIEMIVSVVIFGIILLVCESAVLLAARGIPDGRGAASAVLLAAAPADTLASDLSYATQILSATSTEVSVVIPDRDGDGNPETVTYSWAGKAGNPLLRTYNGRQVTYLPSLQEFALTYDRKTVQNPQTYSEGPEVQLAGNDASFFTGSTPLDASHMWGQYFTPSLPSSATGWRITRVLVPLRNHGTTDGKASLQIRAAGGNVPTSAILDQATIFESSLPGSFAWQQISFNGSYRIAPTTGACIVLANAGNGTPCDVIYETLLSSGAGIMVGSTNGGSSWNTYSSDDLLYYVYGKVTTPDPVTYNTYLTDVRITLRTGSDTGSRIITTALCLNAPQVSGN